MKHLSFLLLSAIVSIGPSCNRQKIDQKADFEFDALDKEANRIELAVTVRYRLTTKNEKQLIRAFGAQYGKTVLQPTVASVSRELLMDYDAVKIYSNNRQDIQQKLSQQTKSAMAEYDLELTDFAIRSVGMADTLLRRLEKEYNDRTGGQEPGN